MPNKRTNAFPAQPVISSDPLLVADGVEEVFGLPARANAPNDPNTQREALKVTVHAVPSIAALRRGRPSLTGLQMQTPFPVRALSPQRTLLANVTRGGQPDADQRTGGLVGQPRHDRLQHGFDVASFRHGERNRLKQLQIERSRFDLFPTALIFSRRHELHPLDTKFRHLSTINRYFNERSCRLSIRMNGLESQ